MFETELPLGQITSLGIKRVAGIYFAMSNVLSIGLFYHYYQKARIFLSQARVQRVISVTFCSKSRTIFKLVIKYFSNSLSLAKNQDHILLVGRAFTP